MTQKKERYRRNLPHITPIGGLFFVTFCTQDSIPKHKFIRQLNQPFLDSFAKYDYLIDRLQSQVQLTENSISTIILEELHNQNGLEYELLYYCIMPNHIHLAFDTNMSSPKSLASIMQGVKGRTSLKINKYLDQSGSFWQSESYDHLINTDLELYNIGSYILHNPVKAELIDDWQQWPLSYFKGK